MPACSQMVLDRWLTLKARGEMVTSLYDLHPFPQSNVLFIQVLPRLKYHPFYLPFAATQHTSNKLSLTEEKKKPLSRRIFVAANNLTQFGVNAQVRILTKRCIFSSQVTFGETLVIFTIIFLFAMVVAGVYNGTHEVHICRHI